MANIWEKKDFNFNLTTAHTIINLFIYTFLSTIITCLLGCYWVGVVFNKADKFPNVCVAIQTSSFI